MNTLIITRYSEMASTSIRCGWACIINRVIQRSQSNYIFYRRSKKHNDERFIYTSLQKNNYIHLSIWTAKTAGPLLARKIQLFASELISVSVTPELASSWCISMVEPFTSRLRLWMELVTGAQRENSESTETQISRKIVGLFYRGVPVLFVFYRGPRQFFCCVLKMTFWYAKAFIYISEILVSISVTLGWR